MALGARLVRDERRKQFPCYEKRPTTMELSEGGVSAGKVDGDLYEASVGGCEYIF